MAVLGFNKKKKSGSTPTGNAVSSTGSGEKVYSDTKGYETGADSSVGGYKGTYAKDAPESESQGSNSTPDLSSTYRSSSPSSFSSGSSTRTSTTSQGTGGPRYSYNGEEAVIGTKEDEDIVTQGAVDITSDVQPQNALDRIRAKLKRPGLVEPKPGTTSTMQQQDDVPALGVSGDPLPAEVGSDAWMDQKRVEEADKLIQEELQQVNRAGQLFDRGKEDLIKDRDRLQEQGDIDYDRLKEDRKYQLEEYKTNVSRQMQDTESQRDQTMQTIRRQAGALGLSVTSTYQESYNNTLDKFNNVMSRLAQDLDTTEGRDTLENARLDADYTRATKQLLEDFEKENKRRAEDFKFSTRQYQNDMILDANSLVEKYGLSSDKLGGALQNLALEAFNNVNIAYGTYLSNQDKEVTILDKQMNSVLDTRNKYFDQEKRLADEFMEGSAMMTVNDLNAMVRDGQISERTAQNTLGRIVQAAMDTIDTNTLPGVGVQFQDQIIGAINSGATPTEAIQMVMGSDDFQGVVEEMQKMGVNPYEQRQYDDQHRQSEQNYDLGDYDLKMKNQELQDMLEDADGIEGIVAYSENKRGTKNLQCGQLVNDYREKMTGSRAGIGDTFQSKVDAIEAAGETDTPQEGGMFAFSTGDGAPGHVGIVMGVNGDGSIEVLEANAEGNIDGAPASVSTYSKEDVSGMLFSQAPEGATGNEPTAAEMAMFNKGAQYIGEKGGLTKQRYNEIADWVEKNPSTEPTKEQQSANRALADDINKDTRISGYKTIKTAYNQIKTIQESGINRKNKSTIDQSLIMLFNKVLDPNSVVKEGEYARSAEGQAFFDQLAAKYNKFVYGGQGIDDNTRDEMLLVVEDLYKTAKDGVSDVKQQYLDTVSDLGGTEQFVENHFKDYELDDGEVEGDIESAPSIDGFENLWEDFDQKYDLNNSALIKK